MRRGKGGGHQADHSATESSWYCYPQEQRRKPCSKSFGPIYGFSMGPQNARARVDGLAAWYLVRSMRLLVFSDLHRDRDATRSLVERSAEADVLIGAGDFAVMRHGIDDVIEILREVDKPVVLVPGNGESDVELREACAGWSSAHVLHGESVTLEEVPFFGIGGGIPVTPFGEWSFDLTEGEGNAMLAGCPNNGVLVSHSPPHGHVDEAGSRHLGSHAVLETIERVVPRLVVCGHIHGCWGQRSMAGGTLVLNAGPEGQVLELPE